MQRLILLMLTHLLAQGNPADDEEAIRNLIIRSNDKIEQVQAKQLCRFKSSSENITNVCFKKRTSTLESKSFINSYQHTIAVSVLSPDEAQQLFDHLSGQKHRFGLGNELVELRTCAARAQLIAHALQEDCRVNSVKVFALPSSSYFSDGLNVESHQKKYHWDSFHIANAVMVSDKGVSKWYVIDPLLFDHAVPKEDWENLFKTKDKSVIIEIASPSRYAPMSSFKDDPNQPIATQKAEDDLRRARRDARILNGP